MRTAKQGDTAFNLNHSALGLAGEAGEYADAIKRHTIYGKELDVANAIEELGDALWFVALGCTTLGVTIEDVALANIHKLAARYPEKYTDELASARLDKA